MSASAVVVGTTGAPAGGVARNGAAWLSWRSHGPHAGASEAEPLILIMGLGVSAQGWFRLLPHISAERRCVVFDNRGTGDSDRPAGRWSMRDMVEDAIAVMDAAGLARAHVMGASMGGMIAQGLAVHHPQRIRSLILACTTAASGGRVSPRFAAATLARPFVRPGATFSLVAPALYARRTREREPERMREDLRRRIADATPASTVFRQIAAIRGHDLRDRLGEIEAPTLVIHGSEDVLVPPERGEELARRIPGARLVLLTGAAHMLTTDAEEETAGAVTSFLREVEA